MGLLNSSLTVGGRCWTASGAVTALEMVKPLKCPGAATGKSCPLRTRFKRFDPDVVVTIHPAAVLRGPRDARDQAFDGLVSDLRFAAVGYPSGAR
jgi:hypothetical protein